MFSYKKLTVTTMTDSQKNDVMEQIFNAIVENVQSKKGKGPRRFQGAGKG